MPGRGVLVVGSLNMDLVVFCSRRPGPGETVSGFKFVTVPGGKGANQAVAAGRLGAHVAMLGRVGDDDFGARLVTSLADAGVDTGKVLPTPGISTGIAVITVDPAGENSIVVVPGANGRLTPDDVAAASELFTGAGAVLLQLEVPLETVTAAARLAKSKGATVVLDPAPAPESRLPDELLTSVDILTPNQHEAGLLAGRPISDLATARLVATDLLSLGPGVVVVKLGERGALIATGSRVEYVPGIRVPAVDTTGAGDAFAGGLAVGLAEGLDVSGAVALANRTAALSVTKPGAQTSMPSRLEVERLAMVGDSYHGGEETGRD